MLLSYNNGLGFFANRNPKGTRRSATSDANRRAQRAAVNQRKTGEIEFLSVDCDDYAKFDFLF